MDWLIADLEMPKKQRNTGNLLGQHLEWIIPHQLNRLMLAFIVIY
ncbi:hypothetical protein AAGS61_15155 [Lysinibacillus sp. KU-BSD001]